MIESGKCDGTTYQQKGWDVFCKIGECTMENWFTSPPQYLIADKIYLMQKGYIKITTDKRLSQFKKLWEELFRDIDKSDVFKTT